MSAIDNLPWLNDYGEEDPTRDFPLYAEGCEMEPVRITRRKKTKPPQVDDTDGVPW